MSKYIWVVGQLTSGSAIEGAAEHGNLDNDTLISHLSRSAGIRTGQISDFGVAGMPGDVGSILMQPRQDAVRADRRSTDRVNMLITVRTDRLIDFIPSFLF
ncbi:hypothetical protein PENTCL1PPCAC_9725, partial [Pristionchus entomophagus]